MAAVGDTAGWVIGVVGLRAVVGAAYLAVVLAGVGVWLRGGVGFGGGRVSWARRGDCLRRRPVGFSDLVGMMVLVGSLSLLAGTILTAATPADRDVNPNALILVASATLQVPVLVYAWAAARRRGGWRRAYGVGRGRMLRRQWKWGGVGFLVMMPAAVGAMALNALAFRLAGWSLETQEVARYLLEDAGVLMHAYKWISAVVLAPLAEEVVFRGLALPLLARAVSPRVGVLGTAVLFAGIHASLSVALPLFVVGVCLAVGYLRTGTLVVPVAMHMGFNAMNLLLMSVFA